MGFASQINHLLKDSGMLDIDTDYKRGEHTKELRADGVTNWHDVAQQTHIVERATLEKYKTTWKDLGNFAKQNGYCTKLTKISADCVKDYLTTKLEAGRSLNTMIGYLTAINKLDAVITAATGAHPGFSGAGDTMRQEIKETAPDMATETRSFNDPRAVIGAIEDPRCKLAAEIQLATGLRVHDVSYIRLNADGSLYINSKAGRRFEHYQIPQQLSNKLREINGGPGNFNLVGYKHYIYEIKKACNKVGEHYTGSHGFRHNYAKEAYARYLAAGLGPEEAKGRVSEDLFHHRLEIIEVYLR